MDAVPVEWLRAVYDEWGRGNFAAGADRLDPEFRFSTTADFADPVQDVPPAGLGDWWRGFLASWSHLRIDAEEIVAAGDRALVRALQSGAGRVSGAETSLSYFQMWRFRDGQVLSLHTIMDEGTAHVDQLHGVYDAWARGDFDVGADLFAPDIEFVTSEGFPDAPTPGTGTPGLERWRDLFLVSFGDLRIEAKELAAQGERVAVRVRQRGVFRATEIPMDISYWHVWWFCGGVVVRWQAFESEEEARAAADR